MVRKEYNMPTKTFYNLPKEKKLRILKAGKKEFSRVPLEKAIIANIAKDADIPRGSFYQYFNNLEDLFTYIIEYLYGFNKKKFSTYLEENNNNIYDALKERFSNEIDKLSKQENKQFRVNTLTILLKDNKEYSKEFIDNIIDKKSSLDVDFFPTEIQKKRNFSKMLDLIKMVGDTCVERYLMSEVSEEEIKNDYNEYIDFVKTSFDC